MVTRLSLVQSLKFFYSKTALNCALSAGIEISKFDKSLIKKFLMKGGEK